MKPEELVICSIRPTWINSYQIKTLEIDLRHINYGLDQVKGYGNMARSNFTIDEVILFFESLNHLELNSNMESGWEYFVVEKAFFKNNKKSPHTSGIITLFQVKRHYL